MTPQVPWKRGFNDFYPLLKWKEQLRESGLVIKYFSDEQQSDLRNCDVLVFDYRYYKYKYIDWSVASCKAIEFCLAIRPYVEQLVLFDSDDSSGSRCFQITPFVDIHLKKQLLRDKSKYHINDGDRSYMPWIPEDHTPSHIVYNELKVADADKVRLAWNIGMLDYRQFPLSRLYPIGTSLLFNGWYKSPWCFEPEESKILLTSYRGSISTDTRYSFQRRILAEKLSGLRARGYRLEVGGKVKKSRYLAELRKSKVIVSPFGWGEICYRDFEAYLYGAILVKPSMEHLETYPDLYIENETYFKIGWNLEGLDVLLSDIDTNYADYLPVAVEGQRRYIDYTHDFERFFLHLKSTLGIYV
jgi:hypothetical protein